MLGGMEDTKDLRTDEMPGEVKESTENVKSSINDNIEIEKSDKLTKDDETILQKELDQIETHFSTLSNNFKKRRLSKNEMDFLESEMNLDLETVTDADFDMHLQKLIGDNVNALETNTKDDLKSIDKDGKIVTDNNDSAVIDDNVDDLDAKNQIDETVKTIIDQNKDQFIAEKEIELDIERDLGTDNEVKHNKENKTKTQGNKTKEYTIGTTKTGSYKGISIPSNSELFKQNETSSVLQEYRNLFTNRNLAEIKEANHINAQLSALPLLLAAPDNLSFNVQMLINSLPVLDNLATQILRIIAKGPYQKVMELVSNRESYTGIAFSNLIELFETTKRIYNSEESPFFTVENITFGLWKYGFPAPTFLKGREDTIEGTLRKVNLSTFLLATLGLIDLGFFFLNEAFLDVFCPPQNLDPTDSLSFIGEKKIYDKEVKFDKFARYQRNQTKFLKAQAILYLELKTQAYISAIELGDRSKEDIIHDLFPSDMDEILLRRKDPLYEPTQDGKIERNSTLFTPAELDFLSRCEFRKQTLLNSSTDSSLMEKYEWIKFLNDLLEYVSKNVGFLIWGPKGKLSSELDKLNRLKEKTTLKIENDELDKLLEESKLSEDEYRKRKIQLLEKKLADESTKSTKISAGQQSSGISVTEAVNGLREASLTIPESPSSMDVKFETSQFPTTIDSTIPTKVTKSKPVKKAKQNRPSTFRRIWTSEEEEALKEGLKLKGTHWTAILELFGPGGKINESLKNRSSLQLKDKARNWKFYYIKNNLPIPDYLSKATGDLGKYRKNNNQANANSIDSPQPGSHNKGLKRRNNGNVADSVHKRQNTKMADDSTSASENTHTSFVETDAVYQDMLKGLLPGASAANKDGSKEDEAVASELKDLVAEAFK